MTACCFCSYKFRQQDKEAAQYWNNRTRRPVPRIVVRGADTGVTRPLVTANGTPYGQQKRLSRTSMDGIGNHTTGAGGGADSAHHSRSNSRTSTRSGPPVPYGPPLPESGSPPPPYSPPAGVILPYASAGSQQHIQLAAGNWSQSPSRRQLPSPQPQQPVRRHSAVDVSFYRRSPDKTPVGARQSIPLTTSTTHTLGDTSLHPQRPHSRSSEFVNRRPSSAGANPGGAVPVVRHPQNPELILPFATGPPPPPQAQPSTSPRRQLPTPPTAPPVET